MGPQRKDPCWSDDLESTSPDVSRPEGTFKGLRELNPSWMGLLDFSQMTSRTGTRRVHHLCRGPAPAPSSPSPNSQSPWGSALKPGLQTLKFGNRSPQISRAAHPSPTARLRPGGQASGRLRVVECRVGATCCQGGAWFGERAACTKPPFSSPTALPSQRRESQARFPVKVSCRCSGTSPQQSLFVPLLPGRPPSL